jgi:hypothetical protein
MKSLHKGPPQYLDLFLLTHGDDLAPEALLSRRRTWRMIAVFLAFMVSLVIAGVLP